MNIFFIILQSAYFLIPAYFANMAPPLAKKLGILSFLDKPVDNNITFKDKRPLFGRNKTYRGYIVGIIGGVIGALFQMYMSRIPFFNSLLIEGINYSDYKIVFLIGILMGFGAIFGDMIESFIKRRLNISAGKSFVPWDQTDLVFGAYLFVLPIIFNHITWMLFVCSIISTFFLHILINHIAYYTGIRKEKW